MAKATFYVQLVPSFRRRYDNEMEITGLYAERLTKRYPNEPIGGAVVTKLTVEIPDAALLPLTPEAVIEVPVEHLKLVVRSEPVPVLDDEVA